MRLSRRASLGLGAASLAGCAAHTLPGYQAVFQGHVVPDAAIRLIEAKFKAHGLAEAQVGPDAVGRLQLLGRYRDDAQVEIAFVIVQSVVGLRACSPFYPLQVTDKRWQNEAAEALETYAHALKRPKGPASKRALVIGINTFQDSAHLRAIQGEDDARTVSTQLKSAGYQVEALLGAQATRRAIEAAIVRMRTQLGLDDTLFIYVSSHGAPPVPSPEGGDQRRMSIVAYDSGDTDGWKSLDSIDYQLRLQRTSVRDSLVQALAQSPCRLTRVFMDTCYIGDMLLESNPDSARRRFLPPEVGWQEADGISWAAWTGARFNGGATRLGYSLLTATSPGQLALGPPPEQGTFPSPLDGSVQLKGSYFTQAFFDYLSRHQGDMAAAFDDASRFTSAMARRVSQGRREQQPRRHSTLAPERDNLFL